MKFKTISRVLLTTIIMGFAVATQALVIDFTDNQWKSAISGNSANIGDITLTANAGNLTFNANDNSGCVAGISAHGLACDGDGIGINDDEITQGGVQSITITFASAVDILNIDVLDLFGNERTGETALIMEAGGVATPIKPPSGNGGVAGGYWETGFNMMGITELVLFSPDDGFSDYALARLDYQAASVPEPGPLALLGLGLFGIATLRRRKII